MEYLCLLNPGILCIPGDVTLNLLLGSTTEIVLVEPCLHFVLDNGFYGDRVETSCRKQGD